MLKDGDVTITPRQLPLHASVAIRNGNDDVVRHVQNGYVIEVSDILNAVESVYEETIVLIASTGSGVASESETGCLALVLI